MVLTNYEIEIIRQTIRNKKIGRNSKIPMIIPIVIYTGKGKWNAALKIEEYQGKKCLTWIDGSNTSKQRFMQGEFKENTQYTFRFSGYSKNNMQISIVYTDGSNRGMTIQGGEEWNEIIFQSTSGKSIDYWCGSYNYAQKVAIDIDSSMIIEGSYTAETMPSYEPYQPPQDFAVDLPE